MSFEYQHLKIDLRYCLFPLKTQLLLQCYLLLQELILPQGHLLLRLCSYIK